MFFKKYIFFSILILSSILESCSIDGVEGSGVVVTESRPITEFTGVYIEGKYRLNIKKGDSYKLFLKMDDNLLDNTIINIEDNILHISSLSNVKNCSSNEVYITAKNINNIIMVGSTDLKSSNVLTFSRLNIKSAGISDIDMDIDSDLLSVELAGSNNVYLKGVAQSLDLKMAGYGKFNSLDLYSENVYLGLSGAVTSKVFSKDFLDVDINGIGKVYYKGNPELLKQTSRKGNVIQIKNTQE